MFFVSFFFVFSTIRTRLTISQRRILIKLISDDEQMCTHHNNSNESVWKSVEFEFFSTRNIIVHVDTQKLCVLMAQIDDKLFAEIYFMRRV